MRKIKNYLLSTIMVLTPSLLLAHPGHEHHGTGLEMFFHYLVTTVLVFGLGAGVYHVLRKRNAARENHS